MPSLTPSEYKKPSKLNRILSSINRLRPLPTNVTRILRALDDPTVPANTIADLLLLDQSLTAYTLRVANSAFMGYGIECSSISEAVVRLGFKRVRELILSTAASGPLARRLNGYRLGDGALWSHSVVTASVAHWFGRRLSYPEPEEAYVAGLLHDIGKLVLDQYVQADYNHIVSAVSHQKIPLWYIEEQLFGIDHGTVGGLIASQWKFPSNLVDAIRFHHAPSFARTERTLASLVNLANALSPTDDRSLTELGGRVVHPEAKQILHLDELLISRMQAEMQEEMSEYKNRQPIPLQNSKLV